VASQEDLLFAEVDRQLGEQRAHADSLASRAGLLIAATAVAASLLAGRLQNPKVVLGDSVLWGLGVAGLTGVLVLVMARLTVGPSPAQLGTWSSGGRHIGTLLAAKITTVEANGRALVRTEVMFYAQATATVASVGLLLLQARKG
jgi:hypothetical protein